MGLPAGGSGASMLELFSMGIAAAAAAVAAMAQGPAAVPLPPATAAGPTPSQTATDESMSEEEARQWQELCDAVIQIWVKWKNTQLYEILIALSFNLWSRNVSNKDLVSDDDDVDDERCDENFWNVETTVEK